MADDRFITCTIVVTGPDGDEWFTKELTESIATGATYGETLEDLLLELELYAMLAIGAQRKINEKREAKRRG